MCIYICIYIYICVCISIYVYIYICVYIYTCIWLCMYVYTYIYDIFFGGILHAIQTTTRKTNIQGNSYLLKVLKSMWGSAFVALRQNMSAESREVMKRLQLRINILFNVFLQKHQGFYNHSGKSSTLRRFCTWPRPFCAEFTVGTAWRKTHGLAAPAYSGT